jgi:hypothetical protein
MTTATTSPARSTDPDPVRRDRSLPLLVAAGVVVLLVVGAVLVFGVARPPSVASLAQRPDPAPSAAVVWLAHAEREACLRIAWPDGRITEPWCDREGGEVVGWTDDGILLRRWDGTARIRVHDPVSGEVTGRLDEVRSEDPDGFEAWWPDVVWTERRDGELVVRLDEDDTELWRVDAPASYDVFGSARSADGAWVAMVDAAGRLLVVPADGSAPPREWASGVARWQPPVWEGTSWQR